MAGHVMPPGSTMRMVHEDPVGQVTVSEVFGNPQQNQTPSSGKITEAVSPALPSSFEKIKSDPFFRGKNLQLTYDATKKQWQLNFNYTHKMGNSVMTMPVETVSLPDLMAFIKVTPPVPADPELYGRLESISKARVTEIISDLARAGLIRGEIEEFYQEGRTYGVLSKELETAYQRALSVIAVASSEPESLGDGGPEPVGGVDLGLSENELKVIRANQVPALDHKIPDLAPVDPYHIRGLNFKIIHIEQIFNPESL